jgi:AcrR family transcriptional regulator
VSRAYRSELREAQARRTRGAIVDAAIRLFSTRGYAATTVRAVADEAGVSVPTVETAFRSKARLLKGAIDVAIAGDDQPVAMVDREFAQRARDAATASEALTVVAAVLAASQQRSAGLVLAAFEGAAHDPDLADLADEMAAQRRTTAGWVVGLVAAQGPLRASHTDSVETLWTLMEPAVFDRVTRRLGWSLRRYQDWFADCALHLLTPDPH